MSLEDSWRGAGISYGCLHWCLLRSRLFCGVPRSASFVCMNSAGITEVCWSFEMHSLLALRALLGSFFFTLLLLLFWFCLPFISKPFSSQVTAKDAERTFSSIHHITQHRLLRFPLPPFLSSSQLQGYFFYFVSQQRAVSSARKRVTLNIPLILFPYLPTAVRTFSPQFESMRADVRQS